MGGKGGVTCWIGGCGAGDARGAKAVDETTPGAVKSIMEAQSERRRGGWLYKEEA